MAAWHEQDRFWETMPIFSQHHREVAPEEVDSLTALLGISRGASVLDLCCGKGRHSCGGLTGQPYDIDARRLMDMVTKAAR